MIFFNFLKVGRTQGSHLQKWIKSLFSYIYARAERQKMQYIVPDAADTCLKSTAAVITLRKERGCNLTMYMILCYYYVVVNPNGIIKLNFTTRILTCAFSLHLNISLLHVATTSTTTLKCQEPLRQTFFDVYLCGPQNPENSRGCLNCY